MAAQLKLIRAEDFSNPVDTVDLLSSGFSLGANGYRPVVAQIGDTSVDEPITLNLQGTSTDDLAAMVQDIDRKVNEVQEWLSAPHIEKYQVWIRVQMEGESNARQAQLLHIMPPEAVDEFPDTDSSEFFIRSYTIGITRTPFWEQPYTYPTQISLNDVDGNAETATYIGVPIYGDVDARVARIQVNASKPLDAFWLGIKSDRFGNPANFVPYWAFADGIVDGIDTVVQAGPGGKSIIKVTFSLATTMETRARFSISDISTITHPEDQRGEYTVLMRAKVDSGTEVMARLRYSLGPYAFPSSSVYRDRVPITFAGYRYYEMGTMQIPPQKLNINDSIANFMAALDVERTEGSGNLYAFGYHLIPTEAWLKVKSPDVQAYPLEAFNVVYQSADGELSAYDYGTSLSYVPQNHLIPTGPVWGLPTGINYLVCVADDQALEFSGYPDAVDFLIDYIPRWRTLRGAGGYVT